MPYIIKKVPGTKNVYTVLNRNTGRVHAYHTTLQKAKAQVRLLHTREKMGR